MPKTSATKRAPKRASRKIKYRGVHEYIARTFVPRGGPRVLRTHHAAWRDGSNLQCGRAVAGGLADFVNHGRGLKKIKSTTARAILSFLLEAGYTPVLVEAPVRCAKMRVATRIDLVAVRGNTTYVVEIKVSSLAAWNLRSTAANLMHLDVQNTPCNRAWVQAVVGAVLFSSRSLRGTNKTATPEHVRARVLHVYPKPHGKGFMVRFVAEPRWVRRVAFPFVIWRCG